MRCFRLKISSLEKCIFDGEAYSVQADGYSGRFTVLYAHAPLVAPIRGGVCHIVGKAPDKIEIGGGILEINHKIVNIFLSDITL